jgi:hypothetical protein
MTELRWLVLAALVAAGCGNDEAVPSDGAAIDGAANDAAATDGAAIDATDADLTDAPVDAAPMSVVVSFSNIVVFEPIDNGQEVGVRLSSQPPGPVDVACASADVTAATVSPATVSFTISNWATSQPIRIAGTSDVDVLSEDTTVTCTPSLSGWAAAAIAVHVSDQTDAFLTVDRTNLTIDEGASGTINVRMTAMPAWVTNVTVTSPDPDAVTVSPATFQILAADWNVNHPVTVTGAQDADALDETVHVTTMSPGQSSRTVTVNVNDDD